MAEYSNAILDSIKILVDKSNEQLKADKTVKATIKRCVDTSLGKYEATYAGGIIYAYTLKGETFLKNQQVYVTVPNGEFKEKKFIAGLVPEEDNLKVSQALDAMADYTILGVNLIKPISLSVSSNKENGDTDEADIAFDSYSYNVNFDNADAFCIKTNITTRLSSEQKRGFNGTYGIAIGNDDDVISIFSNEEMNGDPYSFEYGSYQYKIIPIEKMNKDSAITKVTAFCSSFIPDGNEDKNIFFTDISMYLLSANISEMNGYRLSVTTPNGNLADKKDIILKGTLRKDGLDISNEDNVSFIWGIENVSVSSTSNKKYNAKLGYGWEAASTSGANELIAKAASCVANETRYKCVAFLTDSQEVLLAQTCSIYNPNAAVISISSLKNKSGISSGYARKLGQEDIIFYCMIDGELVDDSVYRCVWSKTQNGVPFIYDMTKQQAENELGRIQADFKENQAAATERYKKTLFELKSEYEKIINELEGNKVVFQNGLYGNQIKFPRTAFTSDDSIKVQCSVQKNINGFKTIGSCEVAIKNDDIADGFSVVIENANQVFQYAENGTSPIINGTASVKPLSAKLYGPGVTMEIPSSNIEWEIPASNSMLVQPYSAKYDADRDAYIFVGEQITPIIADTFNASAVNNQIRCSISVNNNSTIYSSSTNFVFTKSGDIGTSGVSSVLRLSNIYDTDSHIAIYDADNALWYCEGRVRNASNTVLEAEVYTDNEPQKPNSVSWRLSGASSTKDFVLTKNQNDVTKAGVAFKQNDNKQTNNIVVAETIIGDAEVEKRSLSNIIPVPVIRYESGFSYTTDPIGLNKSGTIRTIKYDRDGRNPRYISDFGISLDMDANRYSVEYTALGGKNDAEPKLRLCYKGDTTKMTTTASAGMPSEDFSAYNEDIARIKNNIEEIVRIEDSNKGLLKAYADVQSYLKSHLTIDNISKKIEQYKDLSEPFYNNIKELVTIIKPDYSNDLADYIVSKLRGVSPSAPVFDILVIPDATYLGDYSNHRIEATVYKRSGNAKIMVAVLTIPIHLYIDTYGLSSVNGWDGTSIELVDEENGSVSHLLAPQIGAGVKNGDKFTGLVMGQLSDADGKQQVGLLGFSDNRQSLFIDAETGKATFGLTSQGRIELNPNGKNLIGGWTIGQNSLYSNGVWSNNDGTYNGKNGAVAYNIGKYYIPESNNGMLFYNGSTPYFRMQSQADKNTHIGYGVDISCDNKNIFTIYEYNHLANSRTPIAGVRNGKFFTNANGDIGEISFTNLAARKAALSDEKYVGAYLTIGPNLTKQYGLLKVFIEKPPKGTKEFQTVTVRLDSENEDGSITNISKSVYYSDVANKDEYSLYLRSVVEASGYTIDDVNKKFIQEESTGYSNQTVNISPSGSNNEYLKNLKIFGKNIDLYAGSNSSAGETGLTDTRIGIGRASYNGKTHDRILLKTPDVYLRVDESGARINGESFITLSPTKGLVADKTSGKLTRSDVEFLHALEKMFDFKAGDKDWQIALGDHLQVVKSGTTHKLAVDGGLGAPQWSESTDVVKKNGLTFYNGLSKDSRIKTYQQNLVKEKSTFGLSQGYCLGWVNNAYQKNANFYGFNQVYARDSVQAINSTKSVYPGMVVISKVGSGELAYCGHIGIYVGIKDGEPIIRGLENGVIDRTFDNWCSLYPGPYYAGFPKEWGVLTYDNEASATLNGGTLTINGEVVTSEQMKVAQEVANIIASFGFSKGAIAGVLGNIWQESRLRPNIVGMGNAFGLFQFDPQGAEYSAYRSQYGSDSSIASQVKFVIPNRLKAQWEWGNAGEYAMTFDEFKKTSDAKRAAANFCLRYERPGIPELQTRMTAASAFYNALK